MRLGYNEFYFLVCHLLQLVFRYTLLKCKQELFIDSVSFVNDLTPSVFTCSLSTKYSKVFCGEFEIVIAYTIREKEVWLLVVFCNSLFFVIEEWYDCSRAERALGLPHTPVADAIRDYFTWRETFGSPRL